MMTVELLVKCGVSQARAEECLEPLLVACAERNINTKQRIAGFLAQVLWETRKLQRMEEDLYYKTEKALCAAFGSRMLGCTNLLKNPEKLANTAYANRNGNGDVSSGDGWLYRGRGPFMLTGRANYMVYGDMLGRPYKSQPDLVAKPSDGFLVAAGYWEKNGCNEAMDAADFDITTRKINGKAMHAAKERRLLLTSVLNAMG